MMFAGFHVLRTLGPICLRRKMFIRCFTNSVKVRVRFAPSPTGFLHLGGLRTAFYNFLYARRHGGAFLLRIEDTDQSRLVPGAADKLQEVLEWAGLTPDEGPFTGGHCGPYIQSQRLHLYNEHIQTLLANGSAYPCFCSEKRLELLHRDAARRGQIAKYDNRCRYLTSDEVKRKKGENAPFVVRFKMEDYTDAFEDMIFGKITYNPTENEGDPILIKSDGFPTYHFANVVDDHLMEVSHVLRGLEWHVSTPKHLLLYKAFGWTPPVYGHLPLIINSDGTKLSKRQGDLHVEYFRNAGYFPEAVINFVSQMGGGFGKTESLRLYTIPEMVSRFDIDKVNVNSSRLELERLDACNRLAIQHRLETKEGTQSMVSHVKKLVLQKLDGRCDGVSDCNDAHIENVIKNFKNRITNLDDLLNKDYVYIWTSPTETKILTSNSPPIDTIPDLLRQLDAIPAHTFNRDTTVPVLKTYAKNAFIKYGQLMKFMRLALSGANEGPAVAEMMEVLGKHVSMERLRHAYHNIADKTPQDVN